MPAEPPAPADDEPPRRWLNSVTIMWILLAGLFLTSLTLTVIAISQPVDELPATERQEAP